MPFGLSPAVDRSEMEACRRHSSRALAYDRTCIRHEPVYVCPLEFMLKPIPAPHRNAFTKKQSTFKDLCRMVATPFQQQEPCQTIYQSPTLHPPSISTLPNKLQFIQITKEISENKKFLLIISTLLFTSDF